MSEYEQDTTIGDVVKSDPGKLLTIAFEGNTPIFEFEGIWTGRDVDNIKRLLSRQYQQYTREIRINERRRK